MFTRQSDALGWWKKIYGKEEEEQEEKLGVE